MSATSAPILPLWSKLTFWKTLVAAVVTVTLAWAAFAFFGDVAALRSAAANLSPWAVVFAILAVLLAYVARILRWHVFLRHLRADIHLRTSTFAFLAGLAFTITPGRLGEAAKVYYLWEGERVAASTAFAAVIAERVLDLMAIGVLFLLGVAFVGIIPLAVPVAFLGLVLLGLVLLRCRVATAIFALVARVPRLRGLAAHGQDAHEGVVRLLGPGLLAVGATSGLIAWSLEVAALSILGEGLGVRLDLAACALVFTAGALAGILTMLPGGLVTTEATMLALFGTLGVDVAKAAVLTVVLRLCTIGLSTALGAGVLLAGRTWWKRAPVDNPKYASASEPR